MINKALMFTTANKILDSALIARMCSLVNSLELKISDENITNESIRAYLSDEFIPAWNTQINPFILCKITETSFTTLMHCQQLKQSMREYINAYETSSGHTFIDHRFDALKERKNAVMQILLPQQTAPDLPNP